MSTDILLTLDIDFKDAYNDLNSPESQELIEDISVAVGPIASAIIAWAYLPPPSKNAVSAFQTSCKLLSFTLEDF